MYSGVQVDKDARDSALQQVAQPKTIITAGGECRLSGKDGSGQEDEGIWSSPALSAFLVIR